jgi:hypothetical protein
MYKIDANINNLADAKDATEDPRHRGEHSGKETLMNDYKPGVGAWLRPSSIQVSLPLTEAPTLQYNEEQVTAQGSKPWGPLVVRLDPARVIPLLDAQGEETGATMTGAEIMAALQSAYVADAKVRDSKAG